MNQNCAARLEAAIQQALRAAEAALRADGAAAPVLRLVGPVGEAVIGLGSGTAAEVRLAEKARLLRVALEADLEVATFETRLLVRGGTAARVVVVLAGARAGCTMALAGVYRTPQGSLALRRMAAPIAGVGGSDMRRPPLAWARDTAEPVTPDEAWRRLAALGVNIVDEARAVH